MSHLPIRSKSGQAAVARVRKLCADLPEFEEKQDGLGHTSFRVRNKPFILMGEDQSGCWINIKVEHATQSRLVREGTFLRSPYIGQHGWATRVVAGADWEQIGQLLVEAYLRVAPKSIAKKMKQEQ